MKQRMNSKTMSPKSTMRFDPVRKEELGDLRATTTGLVVPCCSWQQTVLCRPKPKFYCRLVSYKKGNKYVWPEEIDVDNSVPLTEIVQILSNSTLERRGFLTFHSKIIS